MFWQENAKGFLKAHLLAILLAVVVSLASGLPEIYLVSALGEKYNGVFPEISGDQLYYDARAQESRDGYPQLGNPYILELREAPGVSFWVPDAIISKGGQMLGLDVQHTFAFFNFILPPILFLVTYVILLTATRSRTAALLGAALFHLGLYVESFIRSPSPQFNFLFVELTFLAAVWFVQKRAYSAYALAVTLGVLFYVYPYYWTFMFGAVGMFFVATLFIRSLKEYRKPLFLVLGAGTLIGLPTLIQMAEIANVPAYQETVFRLGMIYSRTPAGIGSIAACGIVILSYLIFHWRKIHAFDDAMYWFMGSAVLGGIIASNNQIFTGKNLEFSSHYFLPAIYTALIAVTYLISQYGHEFPYARSKFTKRFFIGIVAIYIGYGSVTSIAPLLDASSYISSQKYGSIITWTKANIPSEKVILTGRYLGDILPGYTSTRIFYSRNANLHVMTDEEAWTRFILQYWDEELTDEFLSAQIGAIWGAHYYDEYGRVMQLNKLRKVLGLSQESVELLPIPVRESFRTFASTLKKSPPADVLGERQIDYAITEAGYTLPSWLKTQYPDMRSTFTDGEFTVFELGQRISQ
jgi:hypothetical protein